jgi:hypothetical protein
MSDVLIRQPDKTGERIYEHEVVITETSKNEKQREKRKKTVEKNIQDY